MLLANCMLPSFIGHEIIFTVLLPAIALIEALMLRRVLKIPFLAAFDTAWQANWRSTVSGLPAGWCMALFGLIPAGVFIIALPPAYQEPAFQVIVFTYLTGGILPNKYTLIAMAIANLLILIPYYIATVRVERRVVANHYPRTDPKLIDSVVYRMNAVTYSIFVALLLWWLCEAAVSLVLYEKQKSLDQVLQRHIEQLQITPDSDAPTDALRPEIGENFPR